MTAVQEACFRIHEVPVFNKIVHYVIAVQKARFRIDEIFVFNKCSLSNGSTESMSSY